MSDILGSILGSALKAALGGQQQQQAPSSGGIGDILAQVLGNTDLGSVTGMVQQLERSGLGDQVASWLGNGQNLPVSVDQLKNALGDQNLGQLASQFGLPVGQLLGHLAEHLPGAIDGMSPQGTLARDAGANDV